MYSKDFACNGGGQKVQVLNKIKKIAKITIRDPFMRRNKQDEIFIIKIMIRNLKKAEHTVRNYIHLFGGVKENR